MLISTRGRYALRVLIDMAEHSSDGYMPLKEVAERQDISEKYLESIVKTLVHGGILTGVRGKGGGYRLAKPPERIGVGEVLNLMEGSLAAVSCLEPDSQVCPRMSYCRTLPLWEGLDKVISEYLDGFTIESLMWKDDGGNDYVI